MAREKKTDIVPVPKADLQDSRWINTPFAYTRLGANFSLLQQEILLKVSDGLQTYVKQYLDEKRYLDKEIPKPLFTSEPLPTIRVKMSELTIDDNHYSRLDQIRHEIMSLDIMADDVDETGQKVKKWMPVFDEVSIPFVEGGYQKTDKATQMVVGTFDKRRGYMDFSINPKVAKFVFDMTEGYVNHMKLIAAYSRRQATPRIYLFLRKPFTEEMRRKPGRTEYRVLKTVQEVKEYLGVIEHIHLLDENNNPYEETRDKYPKFSRFCKEVLDKAREDLLRMAPLNQTDIIFDYVPIYNGSRRRGDPDYIEFRIRMSNLGKNRDVLLHREAVENQLVKNLTTYCPDLDRETLKSLVADIDGDELVAFQDYAYHDARRIIETAQPDDVAAYLMQLFRSWVAKTKKPAEQRPQRVELSLFPDERWLQAWQQCHADLLRQTTNDHSRAIVGQLTFESFNEASHTLLLQVPSSDVYEFLERPEVVKSVLEPTLIKHFGKGVKLQYRLINSDKSKPQGQPT